MTLDVPTPVTRRHAAVAAALSGAALVVVGYASGWGLTQPVAGSVVTTPAVPVAPAEVAPPRIPPVIAPVQGRHYSASGPVVVPTTEPAPTSTPSPPSTQPTGPTTPSGPGSGPTGQPSCTGLQPALRALIEHVDAGHLEESPSQQVADLLDLGQYTTTHTTLLGGLLQPLLGGASSDLDVLLQHIAAGHLEESPAQQAQDLLATDQYVRTHTVLIENLLKPLVGDDGC
ncbi:MAG TPA: hypothetical protein VJ872_16275 [Nocardioides sp.]|nr:hypothetical protein [Nocardioides sp.]